MKGFKYQIVVKVLLNKQNQKIEFAPVNFNSTTKTVINFEYDLDKSFQEVLYRIDDQINEGSGWITECIDDEHVNISLYSPLSEIAYIKLPCELKNPLKDLINTNNNDSKCFLWCHIRHLNPLKTHPETITKADKEMINDLVMKVFIFLCLRKILARLKRKTIFALLCFVMKINWFILFIYKVRTLTILWMYMD